MILKYFAYGSNMFLAKLRETVPSAHYFNIGKITGYKFCINKYSKDGSGKANIVATSDTNDEIIGIIFNIDKSEKERLDISENGYEVIELEAETLNEETLEVLLYSATDPQKIRDNLRPYDWYKEFIIRGAKLYKLPEYYIKNTLEVTCQAMPDVKEKRSKEKWSFIEKNKDVY
jgi:hypothetical protein